MRFAFMMVIMVLVFPGWSMADNPKILDVKVQSKQKGVYSFSVTVKHADTGWKHYVNKWDIVAPDGTVLGTRTLWHPHENEQPFTRSLGGVSIPESIKKVMVKVHDNVHGYGTEAFEVELKN